MPFQCLNEGLLITPLGVAARNGMVLVHVSLRESQEFFYVGDLGRKEGWLFWYQSFILLHVEKLKKQNDNSCMGFGAPLKLFGEKDKFFIRKKNYKDVERNHCRSCIILVFI